MSTPKYKIVKRIIVDSNFVHNEHEVVYDYPYEGQIFDRCCQRYMPIDKFYAELAPWNKEKHWKDIKEITRFTSQKQEGEKE